MKKPFSISQRKLAEIKTEYFLSNVVSIKDLATKHGLKLAALQQRAWRERWREERDGVSSVSKSVEELRWRQRAGLLLAKVEFAVSKALDRGSDGEPLSPSDISLLAGAAAKITEAMREVSAVPKVTSRVEKPGIKPIEAGPNAEPIDIQ